MRKVYDEALSDRCGPFKSPGHDQLDSMQFVLGGPEAEPACLVELRIIGFDAVAQASEPGAEAFARSAFSHVFDEALDAKLQEVRRKW